MIDNGMVPPAGQTEPVWRGTSAADRAGVRRDQLLTAALDLIGERGIAAVGVREVCRRAGLSHRYFYENFTGRDELLQTLFDVVRDGLVAAALTALATDAADTRADPFTRIRAAIDAPFRYLAADRRRMQLLVIDSAAEPALAARRAALSGPLVDILTRQAAAHYRMQPTDRLLETAAHLLAGGIAEVLTAWHTGALERTIDELIDEAATIIATVTRSLPPG